jgi:hypothetical protein
VKKTENRKPHCITLNEEATRQLTEGAARAYLPKNLYIEKLLREEEARHKNEYKT